MNTHGNGPSKKLSALEGPNGSTSSAGSVGGAVGGRRAQKARPCPRLPNLNPFGVLIADRNKGKQEYEVPAFEADQLTKPPACPMAWAKVVLLLPRGSSKSNGAALR